MPREARFSRSAGERSRSSTTRCVSRHRRAGFRRSSAPRSTIPIYCSIPWKTTSTTFWCRTRPQRST